MFRNKSDVDKRVSALLYNAKNEHERNLRCYNIALLYYKAHDFESAQRYATMYLSVRDDSAAAHKLLGQAYEKLGQKDKAITSYTKSLKLESDQSDLILKICELLCEKDVEFDPQIARYWSDRASSMFPHSPSVFMLKEKILISDSSLVSKDLEELLHAELKTKPSDMNVRIKLLNLYADSGRVELAVNHAFEVEARQAYNSLIWYQCINNICKVYRKDHLAKCNWEFYLQWISVLDRMCSLCISETSSITDISEVAENIYNLDQVVNLANESTKCPELFKDFLMYISAQLAFYMGILLLKKAKKENVIWKETKKLVSPLFFLALHPPPSDASGHISVKESFKKLIKFWVHHSQCRIVQAGYVLITLSKENHSEKMFVDIVSHFISGDWRHQIFEKTFQSFDQRNASTSYFMTRVEFSKVLLRIPSSNSLKSPTYISSFENAYFGSLHHLVWLGLQQLKKISILEIKLPSFHTTCFESLQFTISNLNNIGVETINQLDIDTFLYATVFNAATVLENQKTSGFVNEERLKVLPAVISPLLCSSEQSKWWSNVCSLIKGGLSSQIHSSENISDLRFNLQRGIEVVRGEGLPPLLTVAIARTFAARALSTDIIEEYDGCQARALHLWKLVYPVLERFISNKSVITSKTNSLFDFPVKDLSLQDAKKLLEEAKFFIGCHYMNNNQYEDAIKEFKTLKSPQAIYNLAMVYQKWAEEQVGGLRGEEITSEIRCRHIVLATKARDYLVKVKALIRNDSKHPLYSSIETKLLDIDDMLAQIEPENGLCDRDANGTLDGSVSGGSGGTPGFADLNMIMSSSHRNRLHHTSTPRRIQEQKTNNFNMSELIDLLSVQHSTNQLKMQQVLEQVRLVVDKIESFSSEQRSLIDGLTGKLNNFETEMKNNIADIRKDMKRPDICNMFEEDDYTDEMLQYQQSYSQYYPHPQRSVQNSAAAIPYGNQYFSPRLDPLYQGNMSFYNQGALPFSEGQQLPDFLRTIPPGIQKVAQPLLHPSQSGVQGALSHIANMSTVSKTPIHANIIPSNTIIPADPLPPATLQPNPTPLSVNIPPPNSRSSSVPGAPHNFQIPLPPMPKPVLNIEERVEEETPPPAYDPFPDFKPLVPLPKEVEVCTGEEGEEILFERKAKLFRFIKSEWKERGIGNLKILKHKVTGKYRIVMRREQVHKICANHVLTSEINFEPKANTENAWVWVANDYADEELRVEKFCAKFKSQEDSTAFKEVFDVIKKDLQEQKGISSMESNSDIDLNSKTVGASFKSSSKPVPTSSIERSSALTNTLFQVPSATQITTPLNLNVSSKFFTPMTEEMSKQDTVAQNKTNFGGFSFSLSQPKLKIPEESKEAKVEVTKENNPFSKFSFPSTLASPSFGNFSSVFGGKTSISSGVDKSKSVIELKKTFGGTNSEFNNKQNEFVFTAENNVNKNDEILKKSSDFPQNETCTISESSRSLPLAAVIKSAPGSWECKSCYVRNNLDRHTCEACNDKRPNSSRGIEPQIIKVLTSSNESETNLSEQTSVAELKSEKPSLSNILKPPPGSWECKSCYVRNNSDKHLCEACGTKQPGSMLEAPPKSNSATGFVFGMTSQSDTDTPKFTFGSSSSTFSSTPMNAFSFNAMSTKSSIDSSGSGFSQKLPELGVTSTQILKTDSPFTFGTPTFQFNMPKPKVVSPLINKSLDESHDSEPEEEEGDHLQFQPVIPLPEKITVVTGEENETVLYTQRAKLFRFDSSSKEWKERGVGDVKILKHNDTGKLRFLMRRDQVMKICLNHFITGEIILRAKDEKTWLWYAVDYSEGIQTKEQFAIRFKSADVAKEFKDAFDKAQQEEGSLIETAAEGVSIQKQGMTVSVSNQPVLSKSTSNSDSDVEIIYEQKAPAELVEKALALKFAANFYCYLEKPPCPGCCGCEAEDEDEVGEVKKDNLLLHDLNNITETPTKESQESPKETSWLAEGKKTNIFGFNPNINSSAGFSFAMALKNPEAESKTDEDGSRSYFFKDKSSFNDPASKSSIFGVTSSSEVKQFSSGVLFSEKGKVPADKSEKEIFSVVSDTPSFGSIAKTSPFGSFGGIQKGTENFTWEGAGSKLFADAKVKVPATTKDDEEDRDDDDDGGDENKTEDDHDPQYDPIVPLPDKIELKTGEEDEDIIFTARGQLYRYDGYTKEWKQRGIGDMKILKHKTKDVYRLVMRREQVHKLVCNHLLPADFELKNKSEKAFVWSALNYCPEESGDNKPTAESLCIRFKHEEVANKFKAVIEDCIESLKEASS